MKRYLDEKGVIHTLTAPYNPQSNELCERMNFTLMSKLRSMLFQAKLDAKVLAEALMHAVFIQNRIGMKALGWRCPMNVLTGNIPDLSSRRVFCCLDLCLECQQKQANVGPEGKNNDSSRQYWY